MKSSVSIWYYVVSVNLTVKISSILGAFLGNTNFTLELKVQVLALNNEHSSSINCDISKATT